MAQATLVGAWVAPDLSPRSGRIIATLNDPNRAGGGSIIGSSVGHLDGDGALPASGPGALLVTVPAVGKAVYTIRERLDDVDEQTYRITVLPGDTVIDLSTRPS